MKGFGIFCAAFVAFAGYGVIGTSGNVEEIKQRAPQEIAERGWKILRYEGWQYGSFARHGGRVWYHVADQANPNIQYRVNITLWGGELHYHYGTPEKLERLQVNIGGDNG